MNLIHKNKKQEKILKTHKFIVEMGNFVLFFSNRSVSLYSLVGRALA